ncbi:MAG: Fe-coproporphyrin synthase [Gammaproteobacteria bacterium]|nr:Fe-coproporphyrin synthase [Gammaproteobacteria bacterium]
MSATAPAFQPAPGRLPLVTLYVTERCNSRCVTCDYWRHGRIDMSLAAVKRLLPSLERLGTRVVVLSGGEPLLHPDWMHIAECLKSNGIEVWLLTSGLALAKHARRVAQLFDSVTVSLDGADRQTYAAIRGLDAFDKVCEGVAAAAANGMAPGLRVTLQRTNYGQLPAFVDVAKAIGAARVSFLAVDVANPHAFGRVDDIDPDLALRPDDLTIFDALISDLEQTRHTDFKNGFIAESPQKLRRILQYFAAVNGRGAYPPVRCNAPDFSAVIGASGHVQPCFFIPAAPDARVRDDFAAALGAPGMLALLDDIRAGKRLECKTCVCSMWREPP